MSFPNEVYENLSSNLEMKRFLHIVKDNDENSYDYMKPIGELTSYYNFTLLQKVKRTNHTPDCTSLPKGNLIIYRKMKFIEDLIFQLRIKHRQKMIDFSNSVLEFLIKWKKADDGMIIHVNLEELKTYLVADPIPVVALLNKFNFYMSLIQPILNSVSTKENVQNELIYVVEDISKSLIKRTSYFPMHRLQDKFEILFLSPLLPFKEKMDEFIKEFPPQDSEFYLQELFSFVLSFFNIIKISQKPFDSTLVLLVIRLLFDKIYERNVYLTTTGQDILKELSHITVKDFTPPSDFSPPYTSDSTSIIQLFRNDKYFSKAVLELENIVFYTNPFDLLNCVDASLSVIEKSATVYNNYQTMVFPFEVTFELFLAVVIASQIPNWENISKLVTTYTPNAGLCPSFEFSKAKIAASAMQFRNMVDEMHGIDINGNKEKASDYLENVSKNCENKEETKHTGILDNFVEEKSDIADNKNTNESQNSIKNDLSIENNNTNQNLIENANNSNIKNEDRTDIVEKNENSNENYSFKINDQSKNEVNNANNENHEQNNIFDIEIPQKTEDKNEIDETNESEIKTETNENEVNYTVNNEDKIETTKNKDNQINENKIENLPNESTNNQNETENTISETIEVNQVNETTTNEKTADQNQVNENKEEITTNETPNHENSTENPKNEVVEDNQVNENQEENLQGQTTTKETANNKNRTESTINEVVEVNQVNEIKEENLQNESTNNQNETENTINEVVEVNQVNENKEETTTNEIDANKKTANENQENENKEENLQNESTNNENSTENTINEDVEDNQVNENKEENLQGQTTTNETANNENSKENTINEAESKSTSNESETAVSGNSIDNETSGNEITAESHNQDINLD